MGELPAQIDDPFDAMLSTGVQEYQVPLDEVPAKTTEYFGAIISPQTQESPVEPLESCASQTPSTDTLATDKSNNTGIQTPSEHEILSPRAIAANLADPFNSWRDVSGTEWHDSEISPLRKVRPKISIVDKLGSLVERGRVGTDVFGKAYNDRHISDNITTKSHIHHARVKYRSRSSGDEARPIMLPLH